MTVVKVFEYKGYTIRITYYPSSPKSSQYKAEVLNGSDVAFDETLEGAEKQIINKINNIETFQSISFHPLTEEGIQRLAKVISDDETAFGIKQRIKKEHYISDNNPFGFGAKEIFFHYDVIEQTLRKQGYSFNLKCLKIPQLTCNPYYILYDADYYNTDVKITRLVNNLIYESDR